MGSFNIVGDDEGYDDRRNDRREDRTSHRRNNSRPIGNQFDGGLNIIYIVVIMGVVLLGALYFTNEECPTCPVIPACPELNVSQLSCPEMSCPDLSCPSVICASTNTTNFVNLTEADCVGYVNEEVNLNKTMTIMSSTNYSINTTYQMTKDSNGLYDTTELNATYITEQIGEYWVIQTVVN